MRDLDKSATYAAEDEVARWLDAVSPEQPTVNCLGDTFQPEVEAKFTDPTSVQAYVNKVLAHLTANGYTYEGRESTPITVRARRGAKKAEYQRDGAIMAIPPREIGGAWSLRELVVLHEISHHLAPRDVASHGPEFRATFVRLIENIGSPVIAHLLQGAFSARGLNGELPVDHDEKSLDKIAKLLRQAESTANEHEREVFMGRAQSLATRHSIALAVARAHTARKEAREEPIFKDIRIGGFRQRGLAKYVELFLAIAAANDVRCTILSDNTLVTAHGFPSDIAVCEALFASLLVQMVQDGDAFLQTGDHRKETVTTWSEKQWRYVTKPVPTITARLAFYTAYAARIGSRLQEARAEEVAAAEAAEAAERAASGNTPVSTALALREKEAAVTAFYAEHTTNVRGSWRGGRRSGSLNRSRIAGQAGDAAARSASLGGEARQLNAAR